MRCRNKNGSKILEFWGYFHLLKLENSLREVFKQKPK